MLSEQDQVSFFTNIRNGNIEAVGKFIDDNREIVPFNDTSGESAAAVALKSKQLKVYDALISRAWTLGSSENFNEIVVHLKNKLMNELQEIEHKYNQNLDPLDPLIGNFLKENRYIFPNNYDVEGLKTKSIIMIGYEFDRALKSELREINKNHLVKSLNKEYPHLISLITRTAIYFGGCLAATRNRPKYLDLIVRAYEELNDCREIRAIFKIVEKMKNLNIIFDFDRDSVEYADPAGGSPNTQGLTYPETGEVYIGARALYEENHVAFHTHKRQELTASNRSEVLGVIAHELCHVAMSHIYKNDCKSYHKDDAASEIGFENVLSDCWGKKDIEKPIKYVFSCYEKSRWHAELIVRVPHLLALYQGDNDKIGSLKQNETFKMLFDYFEKILPDLEKEENLMSAIWKLKSKEPQHLKDSKVLNKPGTEKLNLDINKVLVIVSNCPQMTVKRIFQETIESEFNFLFLSLYHLKDTDTYELVINALSSSMKPRIVIDCDNETINEILKIAKEMRKDNINERIIFIHNHKKEKSLIEGATPFEISHKWLELSEQSKENLMKKMISFQGENILLGEIVNSHCGALKCVPMKQLLDNYLEIGKELKFPEIDIHVERKFLNYKSEEIEQSELLNIAVKSKLILLSDFPGMGKTTEFKLLAIELKKNLKTFWVAFVDLKEYSDFFENDKKFKSAEEIANFFAKKIFKTKLNEFEKEIFKRLFHFNRVILLLDGFDEISPSFNEFVKMLIKSIKTHSRNILITSTRTHLKDELCKEFGVEAYTLKPLGWDKCKAIIKLNIEKNKVAGKDLKKKIDDAMDFYTNLNRKYKNEPVENPLILTMIANVFSKGQLSKMQENIFSIYKNFIEMIIMKSMGKGKVGHQEKARRSMSELSIFKFYHKEAFKAIFDYEKDYEARKNIDLCFRDVQSLPDEQITREGLVKSDGGRKFQFIHKTFAEFFVADFLFKNVFDLKALNERKKKNTVTGKRLNAIFSIHREVFKFSKSHENYEQLRSFIDGTFETLIPDIDKIGKEVLISTFYNIFPMNELTKYFKTFNKESLLNIITVMACCEIFDKNIFQDIFTENGEIFASIVFKYKRKNIFDFYCDKVVDNNSFPSPYDTFCDIKQYFEIKFKLNDLLFSKDILEFQEELVEIETKHGKKKLQRFLNSWTIDGEPFYFHACMTLSSIRDYRKLWNALQRILGKNDFKILLKKPTRNGKTQLMFKAYYRKREIFNAFWELLTEGLSNKEKEEFLNYEDEEGRNLFDSATRNKDHETFIAVKRLYVNIIGNDQVRKMLIKDRKKGENILTRSVKCYYRDNVATVKELWTFIQDICDESTQKTILSKLKETSDKSLVGRQDFNQKMKIFETFIEEHFTELEKKQFKYREDD